LKEVLCGIYCIENVINDKKYIGLSRDIDRRWLEHRSELNRGDHANKYLQSAWNLYGEDTFKFYVIELCIPEELSDRECYYISKYHTLSHENGYNLTTGGENTSCGKCVIHLISGKIYSSVKDAAKNNGVADITMIDWCRKYYNFMYLDEYNTLSEEQKNYYINFDWESFNHKKLSKAHSRENLTEDTLKKYSQAVSGRNNPRAFAIFSPELGETFWGAKEVYDKYGISRGDISSCINGRLKHAGKHPVTGESLTWQKLEK
jgi:group I intron endonuclease